LGQRERVLAVGLVEDHADVARNALQEGLDLLQRQRGGRGVVGIADQDEPRGDGHLGGQGVEVVAVLGVERDLDPPGTRGGGQMRIDTERRPGVDDLGSGLEQGLPGRQQQVAGAVAQGDAVRGNAVALRQSPAERRVGRVGIAVHSGQHGLGGVDDRGAGRHPALVGGEHGHVVAHVVAGGQRVGGNPPDALTKLDCHLASRSLPRRAVHALYCADSRSRLSALASPR
jgi:hypothetical protein